MKDMAIEFKNLLEIQQTPVSSEISLDAQSRLSANGQLELRRALSAALNVSVAERLKMAGKSWRVDAFCTNVCHVVLSGPFAHAELPVSDSLLDPEIPGCQMSHSSQAFSVDNTDGSNCVTAHGYPGMAEAEIGEDRLESE